MRPSMRMTGAGHAMAALPAASRTWLAGRKNGHRLHHRLPHPARNSGYSPSMLGATGMVTGPVQVPAPWRRPPTGRRTLRKTAASSGDEGRQLPVEAEVMPAQEMQLAKEEKPTVDKDGRRLDQDTIDVDFEDDPGQASDAQLGRQLEGVQGSGSKEKAAAREEPFVWQAVLAAALSAEFIIRGFLFWTPFFALIAFIVIQVSRLPRKLGFSGRSKSAAEEERERAEREEAATRTRMADLLSTPPGTPPWMAIFLNTWWPTIEQWVSSEVIGQLQHILDQEVPPAVALQVTKFYLGSSAPQVSNVQVRYRPSDGAMEVFELDVDMRCSDMSIVIRGTAPVVGRLAITMNRFNIEGPVQLWSVPSENFVFLGFKNRPQISVGMRVEVASQTVDAYRQFCKPIETIIYDTLSQLMVGRRRILVPIEIGRPAAAEVVDGDVAFRVVSCRGLPGASELSRYQVVVTNAERMVSKRSRIQRSRTGDPVWEGDRFILGLGSKWARFFIDVNDIQTERCVGRALVMVSALDDGNAAFWATDVDGKPTARRWRLRSAPWSVTVPLENPSTGVALPSGEVDLDVSVERWSFKQEQPPMGDMFVTPGPRTVIVRIVEAYNVGDTKAGTRFVQVKYNNTCKETQLVANNNHPFWNRVFVFTENPSPQTRRMRLKVLSARAMAGLEDDLGYVYLNLDTIYENEPFDEWLELGGSSRGKLRVIAEIVPGLADSAEVRERLEETEPPQEPGLVVEVVEARGLPTSDIDGSVDPFCTLNYGQAFSQTMVVQNSSSPVYNFKSRLPLCGRNEKLRFECFNFDFIRAENDSLGSAEIDVSKEVPMQGVEYTFRLRLREARADLFSGDGELLVKLSRFGTFERAELQHREMERSMDSSNVGAWGYKNSREFL